MAGEWRDVSLGDLLKVKHGFAFKGEYFTDEPQGTALVTPGNFAVGGGFQADKRKYYLGPVPKEYILKPEQVIVTMTDLSKESDTLGYAAIIPNDSTTWLHNQRVGLLEFSSDVPTSPRFIQYLLRTHEYRSWIVGSATGTTVKHTSPGRIESFNTRIPPLEEQRAIAHILGTLDDKIELNRRMNETLEAMARALFKSWFVDFDPVRAKAEGRSTGLAADLDALFPNSFEESDLGEIPRGWGVGTLEDLSTLNPESWSKETRPDFINYVDLSSTKWGRIEVVIPYVQEDAPSRAQRVLRRQDTIVGTVRPGNGSYALVSDEGLTGSTGFAVLRPKPLCAEFVYLAATAADNIEALAHLADGGAYPAVRPEVIAATRIITPQNEMLAAFSAVAGALLGRQTWNERQCGILVTLRDALLPKLISGELRIKNAEKLVAEAV